MGKQKTSFRLTPAHCGSGRIAQIRVRFVQGALKRFPRSFHVFNAVEIMSLLCFAENSFAHKPCARRPIVE